MTTPSNLWWADEWGKVPRRLQTRGQVLSRRQARRMSRSFAGVGVGIPARRLREIAAGLPIASDELTDVNFAFVAAQIKRDGRVAKFKRSRRRGIRWLMVGGMALVAMNLLLCMAYVLSLAMHASAF
jgi:hypothetical protein